ncbi:MAG TPA: hypothetical protein VNQ74_02295, partial [Burkholderiaceae bacterium]|nr:hypothetical protein [Burkholderiaceae bacterium]
QLIVAAQYFARVIQSDLRAINEPVCFGQAVDRFWRKIIAFQRNNVDAAGTSWSAFDEHKRRHIVQDPANARYKAIASDGRIVVHSDSAGKRRVIMHMHVTTQHAAVGHNNVIAQLTVMRDMAASHQVVVIANACDAVFLLRSAIDRDALANDVVIADDDASVAPPIAQILRISADNRAGKDMIVLTKGNMTH